MDKLRGYTSGLAVPYFVIDAPGGGGKIPLLPEYVVHQDEEKIVLRNYKGDIYVYEDIEGKKEAIQRRKAAKKSKIEKPVKEIEKPIPEEVPELELIEN